MNRALDFVAEALSRIEAAQIAAQLAARDTSRLFIDEVMPALI